jgi:hypothetical protein
MGQSRGSSLPHFFSSKQERGCNFFTDLFKVLDAFIDALDSSLELEWWFECWLEAIPDLEGGFMGTAAGARVVRELDDGE